MCCLNRLNWTCKFRKLGRVRPLVVQWKYSGIIWQNQKCRLISLSAKETYLLKALYETTQYQLYSQLPLP